MATSALARSPGHYTNGSARNSMASSDRSFGSRPTTPGEDPFVAGPYQNGQLSEYEAQLFALNTSAPSQKKHELQAHLKENERRLQDVSSLGTTLVQQREDLTARLKELDEQKGGRDIGPELRRKLANLEKEFDEVDRESSRILPRSRVVSNEEGSRSPRGIETRRPPSPSKYPSHSPSKYTSQAFDSPSKLNGTSKSNRNQSLPPAELAVEISGVLLSQVKEYQLALAQRDETIKGLIPQKSKLEDDLAGLAQRVKTLGESEQRYKDENWSLEMQTQEMLAAAKEAAEREERLNQSLSAANNEKTAVQKEIDDLRQSSLKDNDDHNAAQKHYEAELSALQRTMTLSESVKGALQRKVEELTAQNQKLAAAFAGRSRHEDVSLDREDASQNEEKVMNQTTPENSPPPSPNKGTPRHNVLESETLKSSLLHAHRMIQNLKNNIHREKTEKAELKRMLQDTRDDLELRHGDNALGVSSNVNKRKKTVPSQDVFKKPARPGLLGVGRTRSEILLDEAGWEDHPSEENSPSRTVAARSGKVGQRTDSSMARGTIRADDPTDGSDAFETANEKDDSAGDTEAFETGAESLAGGSSEEHTETESGLAKRITVRTRKPSTVSLGKAAQRNSFTSTTSNSGGEEERGERSTSAQPQQQKFRLKLGRGVGSRRAQLTSEASILSSPISTARNSPASFLSNSSRPTPTGGDQSLFAELGDMNNQDSDGFGELQGTPSRAGTLSQFSTPGPQSVSARKSPNPGYFPYVPPPKPQMVDSGVMTEPWKPQPDTSNAVSDSATKPPLSTIASSNPLIATDDEVGKGPNPAVAHHLPLSASASHVAVPHDAKDEDNATVKLSSDPTTAPLTTQAATQAAVSQSTEKFLGRNPASESILSTTPLQFSSVQSQHIAPVDPPAQPEVSSSSVPEVPSRHTVSAHLEPSEVTPTPSQSVLTSLTFSSILAQDTLPIEVPLSSPVQSSMPRDIAVAAPAPKATELLVESDENNGENKSSKIPTSLAPGFFGSIFGGNNSPVPPQSESRKNLPEQISASTEIQGTVSKGKRLPFQDISANVPPRGPTPVQQLNAMSKPHRVEVLDQSSQTSLSAEELDHLMKGMGKGATIAPLDDGQKLLPGSPTKSATGHVVPPALRPAKSQDSIVSARRARSKAGEPSYIRDEVVKSDPPRPPRRQGSSTTSLQRLSGVSGLPPLPPDHKQAIAAAAQRSSTALPAPGVMGPPVAPASAYRSSSQYRSRSRTSNNNSPTRESLRGSITPRPRLSTARSDVSIPLTRRSSVTSFASELDERFNIRSDAMPFAHGFEGGTDPRMIQAITQTMIGEYLWKYTRKAGRGEMSENRHRRFFWVHPYTRTLYWSDRDPTDAGRAELRAKSVAIEAVRVITDDNPMPPGLHRKSLVVITPGRVVKFTATTGQRHETWFNALSYLLLRTNDETKGSNGASGYGDGITSEDVDEFNPGSRRYSRRDSRRSVAPSLVSYNSNVSRTTTQSRHASPHRLAPPTLSSRPAVASGIQSPSPRQDQQQSSHRSKASISRISSMFKPATIRGSFSSRRSRQSVRDASLYESNAAAHDSANDLRQVIERQERDVDRLENVRACCDGKHDVKHLARIGRQSSHASKHSLYDDDNEEQQPDPEPAYEPTHSRKTFSTNRFT